MKMTIESYTLNEVQIAEVRSDDRVVGSAADALDLLGNIYYQGFDSMILHEKNITPDFFDLKNGMAGEILQKFSNYRVALALVGDFSHDASTSLRAFILESNRGKQVCFVTSTQEALERLANR
jgi:hypothetical protein